MLPAVSIGIPSRNRAQGYLREALGSAVAQAYANLEILVADNGSTDGTEAVVRGWPDPRIRYFRHPTTIAANDNFNFLLAQARGDYFLLLHDDDAVDADFVDACLRAVDYRTDVGIIRTGTRIVDPQGTIVRELVNDVAGLSLEEWVRGWFGSRTTLYLCSTLFNTRRLREAGGFISPRLVFQDVFAMMRLAAQGRADVREIKATFRRHPAARTFSSRVSDWCEDSRALLDLICELVPGGDRSLRDEGLSFFANLNYGRAAEARSPLARLAGYGVVFKKFDYRVAPSRYRLYALINDTAMFTAARHVKRAIERALTPG
jgi:glycosyltransferase involved in cell wall biosynthesis